VRGASVDGIALSIGGGCAALFPSLWKPFSNRNAQQLPCLPFSKEELSLNNTSTVIINNIITTTTTHQHNSVGDLEEDKALLQRKVEALTAQLAEAAEKLAAAEAEGGKLQAALQEAVKAKEESAQQVIAGGGMRGGGRRGGETGG